MQIRGDQGEVVEELRNIGGGENADEVAELFRVAMNSARNADAVIDSIIDDLADPF
ncbi:hypothetical protein [Streptomyces sp. NPDC059759]|uniref:hypothetical protein n=1 Tax=Streptomyces sp. NPDC059759 TaxID=3346936 RepID=UPI0036601794